MKIQILRLLGINNDKSLHTAFVMHNQQHVYIFKTRPDQLNCEIECLKSMLQIDLTKSFLKASFHAPNFSTYVLIEK